MANSKEDQFLFTLKCYQAGFEKNSFERILSKLGYVSLPGPMVSDTMRTTQGREMLDYYNLIDNLYDEQRKEEKEYMENKFPFLKGERR